MTYALITGASKGIGKAFAIECAKRGFNVLLVARSEQSLKELAQQLSEQYKIQADFFATDLSLPGSAQNVYSWCIKKNYAVNILVNNAGYGLSGSLENYNGDEYINMMQVNMMVPVYLIQLFLPMLHQQPRSYILNIASTAAYQAVPYLSVYSATKAFILSYSRAIRQELKNTGISVTCISPGATDTDFTVRAKIGEKGLKAAEKFNMSPEAVAKIAIRSMLAGKAEVITGFINKLGAFMVWLLPKDLVERTAMKIYQ
ncbi:MAG TPA: SDR family oxidoreductase [Puia sp.]|nr:SDR family oxidoreductase [Puia sp.]